LLLQDRSLKRHRGAWCHVASKTVAACGIAMISRSSSEMAVAVVAVAPSSVLAA